LFTCLVATEAWGMPPYPELRLVNKTPRSVNRIR
jgi:hypothetical protein